MGQYVSQTTSSEKHCLILVSAAQPASHGTMTAALASLSISLTIAQYDSVICKFRPVSGLQIEAHQLEAVIAHACCSYLGRLTSMHYPHVTKINAKGQVPGSHQAKIQLVIAAQTIMHAWLGSTMYMHDLARHAPWAVQSCTKIPIP